MGYSPWGLKESDTTNTFTHCHILSFGFPWWLSGKESTMQEMQVQSLGQEDPLEKEVATHSSILVWEIPWTENLEGYSACMGLQRV